MITIIDERLGNSPQNIMITKAIVLREIKEPFYLFYFVPQICCFAYSFVKCEVLFTSNLKDASKDRHMHQVCMRRFDVEAALASLQIRRIQISLDSYIMDVRSAL